MSGSAPYVARTTSRDGSRMSRTTATTRTVNAASRASDARMNTHSGITNPHAGAGLSSDADTVRSCE